MFTQQVGSNTQASAPLRAQKQPLVLAFAGFNSQVQQRQQQVLPAKPSGRQQRLESLVSRASTSNGSAVSPPWVVPDARCA